MSAGEYLQTPAQLKTYKQYSMCINCLLCYSACPQYALTNQEFIGPAALALAHRYNMDSATSAGRRARTWWRRTRASGCSFVGACSVVCPKDVDPAGAIQQMKFASAVDYLTGMVGSEASR